MVSDKFFFGVVFVDDQYWFIQWGQLGNLFQYFEKVVGFVQQIIFVLCYDEFCY